MGLKRHHPELFEQAKAFESRSRNKWVYGDGLIGNGNYTWSSKGTLDEMVARAEVAEAKNKSKQKPKHTRWQDELRYNTEDDDPEEQACLICSL